MSKSYDAVIMGAGVIGLTQAVALTQAGFHVAVVDQQVQPVGFRKLNPTYDVRVFAINRYTQQYLEKWGIWDGILERRSACYHQVSLAFNSSQPNLNLKDSDDAEPNLGHIVEQEIWRAAALEKLLASDLCEFFWESTVAGIERSDNLGSHPWIITSLNPGYTLQTQLLIGADGAKSKVRELHAIQCDRFPTQQTALIFNIQIEHPHHFEARQYFSAQGITAFLPLPGPHHYSIVWSIPDDQLTIKDLSDETLACELNNICSQQWGNLTLISKHYSFPLIQQQARNYIAPQMTLIGDAAHVIHPLAGQGANLGVADIAELTSQLCQAKALQRPLGDSTILKPYERARRSAAWQMMGLMNTFQGFSENPLARMASSYFIPLADKLPFVKNMLSRFALYRFTE